MLPHLSTTGPGKPRGSRCKGDHCCRHRVYRVAALNRATWTDTLVENCTDDDWRRPLEGCEATSRPPVVALGKFEALHKGHRSLAAAAVQLGGTPVLLSFTGMAQILGWTPRLPLVALCDRSRVLHLWSQELLHPFASAKTTLPAALPPKPVLQSGADPSSAAYSTGARIFKQQEQQQRKQQQQQQAAVHGSSGNGRIGGSTLLGGGAIRQRNIPFAAVRSLSPAAFVDVLADDFKAAGVVAGKNYRFGYKAAGDSALLRSLATAAGMGVAVVELVGAGEAGAVGVVSSSKIRGMLAQGRLEAVRRCLGRQYRLVAEVYLEDGTETSTASSTGSAGDTNGVAVGRGDVGGQPLPSSCSTCSSSGECNGAPTSSSSSGSPGHGLGRLQWLQGDSQQVAVPLTCCCNQPPGPGVYHCQLQLHVGATAQDDLLQLESAAIAAAPGGGDGALGWEVEVEVTTHELLLPAQLVAAALNRRPHLGGIGGTTMLVAIDFERCLRHICSL